MIGYAELLDDEVPAQMQDLTRSILSGGHRLMGTLNAVLDLAQIEAGQMRPVPYPVDARALPDAAVRDVRSLARAKGVALVTDMPADLPVAMLDAGLVDRIVCNLLGNAVKFTERGTVTLRARHDAGLLEIEVANTGIGILPAALPYLFDEFQQVSEGDGRTHEGNGLGLAIVQRVAALIGGRVAVESAIGRGTAFRVVLPAPVHTPALAAPDSARAL